RFEVDVASATEPIDAAALIGKDVALSFAGNGAPRTVHGIVTELRHGPRARHFHTARVVVGPAVEVLRLRSDCRIFQELAVDAIVDEVLKAAGVASSAYRFELSRAPPAREFCVQYRESDWAFVNRILEDEGIFYYFVDDGDACTLV